MHDWTMSHGPPARRSTGGQVPRCQSARRHRAGSPMSATAAPGTADASSRSFQELANSVIASRPPDTRTSASASRWTYSPTPVRVANAGR